MNKKRTKNAQQTNNYQLQTTIYQLPTTNYQLPTTNNRQPTTNNQLLVDFLSISDFLRIVMVYNLAVRA